MGPGSPAPSATRAAVLGEFGGVGLKIDGHWWSPIGRTKDYELVADSAALTSRYLSLVQGLQRLMVSPGLSASVYTEITDVEGEINGFFTYDRAILKVDLNQVRTAHLNLIAASRQLNNQGPLPTGQFRSLQVTTPNYTHRYLRHFEGQGFTEVVDGNSSATLKQDATFRLVPGLAESSCYSFESRNFPGSYLRHSSSRIRRDSSDGTALFDQDATFCAQPGLSGTGVSFESFNFPGRDLRHYASEVWTASGYGTLWDSAGGFNADSTWNVAPPWAP